MRVRRLTNTGDYSFGNGQADFYRDVPAAVGQVCGTRLRLWLGEWFLDDQEGTPYMEGVLGKHSKAQADVTIQNRVTGTQGLTGFKNYESTLSPVTRKLSVRFDIDTVFGPSKVELQNFVNF
jgi:hypothetical protein